MRQRLGLVTPIIPAQALAVPFPNPLYPIPETIRKNVKANVKGAYFGPKGEEKDKGRYTPAARKKEVSSQDYRIYQRTRKS